MSDLFRNRAAMKTLARDRDEERLLRGEVSASELQRENMAFRGFRKDVIGFEPRHKPESVDYVPI